MGGHKPTMKRSRGVSVICQATEGIQKRALRSPHHMIHSPDNWSERMAAYCALELVTRNSLSLCKRCSIFTVLCDSIKDISALPVIQQCSIMHGSVI